MRKIAAIMLILSICLLCACQGSSASSDMVTVGGSSKRDTIQSASIQFSPPGEDEVYATITTNHGDIRVILYPQYAPLAVENFCTLATLGFYDDTIFHRIIEDFIIQAGDATGTGLQGATIWGTTFATESTDLLRHYSGALCVAGVEGEEFAGTSQFYIVATPQNTLDEAALQALQTAGWSQEVIDTYAQAGGAPYLDHTDTVFGQVIAGMDVVDAICGASVDENSYRPKNDIVIEGITIENYPSAGMLTPPSERQPLDVSVPATTSLPAVAVPSSDATSSVEATSTSLPSSSPSSLP